ncbi:Peptide transporter family 1, partial [Pseudolycoriella hygida]
KREVKMDGERHTYTKFGDDNTASGVFNMPKAVPVILLNILLERFSTTAASVLYLNRKLNFDSKSSTAIFHTYEMLVYGFNIVGAIIADSWWGHYNTVLSMSLLCAVGNGIVSIGAIERLNLPVVIFTFIGLVIAVVGAGSIRANLIAFGGDQYIASQQTDGLKLYFSIQFFFFKIGSLLGRSVNPILKENVECLGMAECYPLGFGAPAVAMIGSFFLLLTIRSSYKRKPPSGNMLVKVIRCMTHGIRGRWKHKKQPNGHWLDSAERKCGAELVAETKIVTAILKLYTPLPFYWVVYMQQGSGWILQASRMNGNIGFYTVTPEQMIALNSAFAIMLLPICNYLIYPLLYKLGIKTLLQKVTVGGMLAAVASIVAAFVETEIEKKFVTILWLVPQYLLLAL